MRRKPTTTKKSGRRQQNGQLNRRVLLSGLGSGLALSALGAGAKSSKGPISSLETPGPRTNSSGLLTASQLQKIEVDSNDMTIRYSNKNYLTFDFKTGTVKYVCLNPLSATPKS